MKVKISYAITVCNEINELQELVSLVEKNKQPDDEIVILFDSDNGTKEVEEYLRSHSVASGTFSWFSHSLNNDFASFKNKFLDVCTGTHIFQIDADELPSLEVFEYLPGALEIIDCDCFRIARRNIVHGIQPEHIAKWGWRTTEMDGDTLINYPDFQERIFENNGVIKWKNKVHEVLTKNKSYGHLPDILFLWHKKDIKRQEKQNAFYEKL